MRIFPRSCETAVKVLREICADSKNPNVLRARCAELILEAYGLAALPAERESAYRELKRIKTAVQAKVDASASDGTIVARIREEAKARARGSPRKSSGLPSDIRRLIDEPIAKPKYLRICDPFDSENSDPAKEETL